MIQIRRGAFETNSSSVHAIVVSKEQNEELNTNQVINFGIARFGWNHEDLDDIDELATYFYTAACQYYERDMQSEIRKILPSGVDAHFAIPKFDTYEIKNITHRYLINGSIDHVDELADWLEDLMSNKEKFWKYLFGKRTYIVISNDNEPSDEIENIRRHRDKYAEYINKHYDIYIKGN